MDALEDEYDDEGCDERSRRMKVGTDETLETDLTGNMTWKAEKTFKPGPV